MQTRNLLFQRADRSLMSGAQISIFLTGTTTLAPLFNPDGSTLENPFPADGYGRASVAIADGLYDIRAVAGGTTLSQLQEQWLDLLGAKNTVVASAAAAATSAANSAAGASNAAAASTQAMMSAAAAQVYAQAASLFKIYPTHAAASSALANIPANAWICVAQDETVTGSPMTMYQDVAGALTNQTVMQPTMSMLSAVMGATLIGLGQSTLDADARGRAVSIEVYGAKSCGGAQTFDSTAAFTAAFEAADVVYVPRIGANTAAAGANPTNGYYAPGGITIPAGKALIGPGTIYGNGSTSLVTLYGTMEDVELVGFRMTNESAAGDVGVILAGAGFRLRNCRIHHFASYGYVPADSPTGDMIIGSQIVGNEISYNGMGCETGDFEYICVALNNIHHNGFNNAMTGWAALFPTISYGLHGRFANTQIIGNQITENAAGVCLSSSGGANPDHNFFALNVINHNVALGASFEGLHNWETVMGNVMLSTGSLFNGQTVPAVVNPVTGKCNSWQIVDCVNANFIANTSDCGTDTSPLRIYGHGRCTYTFNRWFYGSPTEMRVPSSTSVLGQAITDGLGYGYTVNADNFYENNICQSGSTAGTFPARITLMEGTLRSPRKNNFEDWGTPADIVNGQPGMLTDGYDWPIVLNSGWTGEVYARKEGSMTFVTLTLSQASGAGAVAFTLPAPLNPYGQDVWATGYDTVAQTSAQVIFRQGGSVQPEITGTNPWSCAVAFKNCY